MAEAQESTKPHSTGEGYWAYVQDGNVRQQLSSLGLLYIPWTIVHAYHEIAFPSPVPIGRHVGC
jgi:hypothetical protein